MADKFVTIHSLKFYEYNTTSFTISVVKNTSWNSYYVSIQRNAPYKDKNGETKESCHSIFLTLNSVHELLKHLEPALRFAEGLSAQDKGTLIFYEFLYTMYNVIVYESIAQAAASKKVDSTDGRFEDFLTAGVRTAQLVAAGARVASDVAGAVLTLCRSGSDDRHDLCGVPSAGSAAAQYLGQPGAASSERTDPKCHISGAYGSAGGENFVVKREAKAPKSPERKPKRGRPKKEEDEDWETQCPEAAKRPLSQVV